MEALGKESAFHSKSRVVFGWTVFRSLQEGENIKYLRGSD